MLSTSAGIKQHTTNFVESRNTPGGDWYTSSRVTMQSRFDIISGAIFRMPVQMDQDVVHTRFSKGSFAKRAVYR